MCHNKRQRFEESMYRESQKHCEFRGMTFLPFLIVSLFFFVPHLWVFAAHAWDWLLPLAISTFFFAKFVHTGASSQQSLKTKEEPSLLQSEREYRQQYQEGGRVFSYPDREVQVQRSLYEEPNAQYPQNIPPIE
jgi:hypothetical protein